MDNENNFLEIEIETEEGSDWDHESLDVFIENFISTIEESLPKELSAVDYENERMTFEYLGIQRGCEKRIENINNGCPPLPDKFYDLYDELKEVEVKIILNAKKMDRLFSEIKKLEESNNTYHQIQESLMNEFHSLFDYEVENPE